MAKIKQPTHTSLVERALLEADDFVSFTQLKAATGLPGNHVSATLTHLKGFKAVDSVESQGSLWWFATPQTDTRQVTYAERTPEVKPRKSRKTVKPGLAPGAK